MKSLFHSLVCLVAALVLAAPAAAAENDISPAERAIFMEKQLANIKPPATLQYDFRRSGTLEAAFDDKVQLALKARPDGTCCAASGKFLSGARQVDEPEVADADANPAILYFLERDIREMERLTKGKANYFRKRIRMAVFQGAVTRSVTLSYRGKPMAVREITVSPYLDDPNRAKFEQLAKKRYVFLLAATVPGGLYGIRTQVDAAAAGAPPLLVEEMLIDGAASSK
jgi:hypothetical protein